MTHEQIAIAVEQIISSVVHDYDLDADVVTQASRFGPDLGMDNGDLHATIMRCEETFRISISDDAITDRSRVSDLTEIISCLLREKAEREARAPEIRAAWLDYPTEE